jgi:molecular chaperone Hsp33
MARRNLSLKESLQMMQQSLDKMVSVYCPQSHVRLVLANVTDTAKTLERNHLCGPIAGVIQAEFVGGMALLGTLLDAPGQRISLRVDLPNGLLGGGLLECSYGHTIRGYMRRKVLPDLDDSNAPSEELFDRAMGRSAHCGVIRSDAHGGKTDAVFDLNFKDRLTVTDIIEEYFCSSLQRRALVQLSAASKQNYVACSHALLCDFLPEATEETYRRIEQRFASGEVQDALDRGLSIQDFIAFFQLDTPSAAAEEMPVRFACHCSSERVIAMLRSLPKEDLVEMIEQGRASDIYCHMCGKGFSITVEQLKALVDEK